MPLRSRVLARSQFVNAIGDGAFYVTAALGFTSVVGLSPTEVGAGLSLAWLLGAIASSPMGSLAQRVGLRRSTVVLCAGTAVALCSLALVRSLEGFLAAAVGYAVAQSVLGGVRQALLADLVDPGYQVQARAGIQIAQNAGIGVGAAAAGATLLLRGVEAYPVVLLADAASFLVAGLLLTRLPALNAVLYLYMPVLSVLAPLWVAGRTTAPTWTVSGLFLVNTVGVVLSQRSAARRVRELSTAATSLRRGGLLLGAGCVGLWAAGLPDSTVVAALLLPLGAALLTAGEVRLAAGSWQVGFTLADPRRSGAYQGLYASAIPVARAAGPTVLVALVLTWSGPGWWVLAALFVGAATALASLADRAAGTGRREVPRCSSELA